MVKNTPIKSKENILREKTYSEHYDFKEEIKEPIKELVQITHGIETDKIEAGTIIRPLIRDIRNKLKVAVGLEDGTCFIQNVRGRGYLLTEL